MSLKERALFDVEVLDSDLTGNFRLEEMELTIEEVVEEEEEEGPLSC
jgi:hypothetical protein